MTSNRTHHHGGLLAALLLTAALPGAAGAQDLQSAGALAWGDGNTLFVGDNRAGLVHAFDLGSAAFDDQAEVSLGRMQTFEGRTLVEDIYGALAALLGTTPDDIEINDMVVHEPTRQMFLSVHRGRGPDAVPAIVQVNDGALEVVDLSSAAHTTLSVGPVPTDATLEFGQLQNTLAITDIDYFDGEIFVSGVSNDDFSSTLRRAAYPFDGAIATSKIEIWHAVHAQFETRAPIITQDIQVIDGTPTLIAVYACTPLVRIPLSDLQDGAQIRGDMIGELGFGNTPIDILTYTDPWDSNQYVVVTNTNRTATRVALTDIGSAATMPYEGPNVFTTAGVPQFPLPLTSAQHIDQIDGTWVAVVRANPFDSDKFDLHTLPLPFFFDRADHVVEMNWPGSPDPFGYRQYQ